MYLPSQHGKPAEYDAQPVGQHGKLHSWPPSVPSKRPSSFAQHVLLLGAAQQAAGTFVPPEEPSTRGPKPPRSEQSASETPRVPQGGPDTTGAMRPSAPKTSAKSGFTAAAPPQPPAPRHAPPRALQVSRQDRGALAGDKEGD